MNQFPFEFTWLDGPALKRYLDVLSVSKEMLSVSRDAPFLVSLSVKNGTTNVGLAGVIFSGIPQQARPPRCPGWKR